MTTASPPPWLDAHGRPMRRLELHLTYTCPERCSFCSEEARMAAFRPYRVTWGRVARVLRQQASRGVTSVHLTGGEPTIHPRFTDVLRLARKLGMRTSVGTIGFRLARPDFAREAIPLLDEALFSLHGPDAETHDALTGKRGCFDRVVRAMQNTLEVNPDFDLFVNSVVTPENVERLPETAALAGRLGARLLVVSNQTPEGGAEARFDPLFVPLSTLARVLPQVPARCPDTVVRFFGVPMCLLGEHWALSNDLHWDPRVTVEWVRAPGAVRFEGLYNWTPDRRRQKVAECAGCARAGVCMGVFDTVAARCDLSALSPQ